MLFINRSTITVFQIKYLLPTSLASLKVIQQLTNSFCEAVDSGKEVRVIFFDVSKVFDRIWHRGLIHKLQGIGLSGEILDWFHDCLTSRQQRVVLNGKASAYKTVPARVPQGSILGPLLI